MSENKKNILIVDDDELILRSLFQKLTLASFSVIQARNGKKGLDFALKYQPNIIILDVLMPVFDGIKMLKKLRQDSGMKKVPIILLTNLDEKDPILKEIFHLGPIHYCSKQDLQIERVVKKIKDILKP